MNTSEQGRSNRPLAGIAWMVGGMFMLSVMDTLSKHAVEHLSTPVLVAIRSAMVLLLVLPWVARAGGLAALRTRRPLAHVARGSLSVCSLLAFFESLRLLPLATVVAICFAAPLFMTLMSVVLLREHVGWQRWTALAAGFAGVSVIIGTEVTLSVVNAIVLLPVPSRFNPLNTSVWRSTPVNMTAQRRLRRPSPPGKLEYVQRSYRYTG